MKVKTKKKPPTPPPLPPRVVLAPLPNRAALVYQHNGYATVVQVENATRLASKRGRSAVIYYGIYRDAWVCAETLAFLGWEVATYSCPPNAGLTHTRPDVPPKVKAADVDWSQKHNENPALDLMINRVVVNPLGVSRPLTAPKGGLAWTRTKEEKAQ